MLTLPASITTLDLVANGLAAAGFLGIGLVGFFAPTRVTSFFGIPALTHAGASEVRGVYGGCGLALAVLLVWTLWLPAATPGAQLAVGVALGGMAAGRGASCVLQRSCDRFTATSLLSEAAVTTLLLAAWHDS